ncbi:AI-2E family transporter [Brevibacterium daeguense]|uniref:AI-2E family transporter n=1 Tax=Brevibacterium daeguense TaxID=909936 RepID=A0ABP8EMJ4_9MICO|nr:AI-2E family transporter [Brevibacterium daeguense]
MANETGRGMTKRLRSVWDDFRAKRDEAAQRPGGSFGTLETGPVVHTGPSEEELARGAYEPYVAPPFRLAAAWSWRGLVVLAAIGVAVWLLSRISVIVLPGLIALLIAALLSPPTAFLRRHGWPRALAAAATFIGFLVLVVGLVSLTGQQLVAGFSDLADQVVAGFRTISDWLLGNPFGLDSTQISKAIDDGVNQLMETLQSNSGQILGGAVGAATSVGSFFTGLLLTLFTAYFFLFDGRQIFSWFIGLLPKPARARAEGASLRGWQTLVQYVRVQIIVAGVDAIGIGLGAFFLGLPLVIPLTVLVFMGSFIPIVGAVVTGFIAVVVALVSQGFVSALIMLGVVLLVQQLEGNVLQPFIMGKAVSVHPLAVVLAVAAGSFLYGIPGALFAVPVIAVINTVVLYLAGRDVFAPDSTAKRLHEDGEERPLLEEDPEETSPLRPTLEEERDPEEDAARARPLGGAGNAYGADRSPGAESGRDAQPGRNPQPNGERGDRP